MAGVPPRTHQRAVGCEFPDLYRGVQQVRYVRKQKFLLSIHPWVLRFSGDPAWSWAVATFWAVPSHLAVPLSLDGEVPNSAVEAFGKG